MTDLWPAVAGVGVVGWVLFVAALTVVFRLRRRCERVQASYDALDAASGRAVHEIDELREEVERTRDQRDEAARQRQELFERISGFLGERDQWRELYYTQVREHGNAQALMMRNLERYERHCQATRARVSKAKTLEEAKEAAAKKPPVEYKTLELIAREFVQSHLGPDEGAKERLDRLKEAIDGKEAKGPELDQPGAMLPSSAPSGS
jgi:chromosome segregation ATPase